MIGDVTVRDNVQVIKTIGTVSSFWTKVLCMLLFHSLRNKPYLMSVVYEMMTNVRSLQIVYLDEEVVMFIDETYLLETRALVKPSKNYNKR